MTTTVFTNGTIRRLPGKATAEWVLIADEAVDSIGNGPPPAADRLVDLQGGTIVPAFRDAHVHLPATGLYAAGLDFRGETKAAAILDAFATRAAAGGGVLFGGNFEDPLDEPLTRFDLDRVVGTRPALLARADMHSCIVSTALLDQLDVAALEGVDVDAGGRPSGYLREQAAAQAWTWFDRSMEPQQQRKAVLAAVELAYSKGLAEVHEMFVVEWRGWDSAEVFAEIVRDVTLDVQLWLGTNEVERVTELSLPRIGGDFFLDGSFGSHTAWMTDGYVTAPPEGSPPEGISYRSDTDVYDFFLRAQRAGLQTGVHAIGDAAIEQAIAMWEKVASDQGIDAVRTLGHRIEHFECASDDHISRALALGLRASVQPAFDLYWGGPDGLYSGRLGWERARSMNRFKTMLEAGLSLAGGSDSTVTPMDPFLQMQALRSHHVTSERMSALEALRVHTIGPARVSGHHMRKSTLEPGMQADLVWIDRDPVETAAEELTRSEVLGTWIGGRRVWPRAEAEAS